MTSKDRRLLYRYKGDSCEYCGTTVQEKLRVFRTIAGFNFHHLDPIKKSPEYDNLIRRKLSSEHFDEVDKCALLCRNCHDTLHGQDITVPVDVTLKAEGIEPIQHVLTCQVICDYEKQECKLFSDEFRLLQLYRVRSGSNGEKVLSGIQLQARLKGAIYGTKDAGLLIVCDFVSDEEFFRAEPIDEKQVRVRYNLDFPLASASIKLGTEKKKDHTNLFLRPGQFIASIGDKNPFLAKALGRMTMDGILDYDQFADSYGTRQ